MWSLQREDRRPGTRVGTCLRRRWAGHLGLGLGSLELVIALDLGVSVGIGSLSSLSSHGLDLGHDLARDHGPCLGHVLGSSRRGTCLGSPCPFLYRGPETRLAQARLGHGRDLYRL